MPTPNTGIPYVPENTTDPAAGLNLALNVIDALLQTAVIDMNLTAPPGSPADGDLHIVAASATGDWAGEDNNLARYVADGDFWQFYDAGVNVYIVLNMDDGGLYAWTGAAWALVGASSGGASIGVQYTADTGSTSDSDPGAGLMKWNNATQASATELYLDDTTSDGVSLTGWWSALDAGGFCYLQHATDQDTWQIWEITTVTDATGYVKLSVTLLADGGSFADGDPMLVTLQQGPGSAGAVSSVNGLTGSVDTFGTGLDADATGFRGIPQNSQSGNYTCVAADSGKEIFHPSGAGAGDTFTIPANASVAYEIGTAITFTNMDSNALTIAITTDTMYREGTGATGSRTLAQYCSATAKKITSTAWLIYGGSGLT